MTSKNSRSVLGTLKQGTVITKCTADFSTDVPKYSIVVSSEDKLMSSVFDTTPKRMIEVADFLKKTAKKAETEWKNQQKKK